MDRFVEITRHLPPELRAEVTGELYGTLDIERLVREGVPRQYAQNPVIPYMEIEYPYIRFKPVRYKGGINVQPTFFNDLVLDDNFSFTPQKDVMDKELFHDKTVLHKLVIYAKNETPNIKNIATYVKAARKVIIYNPNSSCVTEKWYSKVCHVRFTHKYVSTGVEYHSNIRVFDYVRIKYSGVESMATFICQSILAASHYGVPPGDEYTLTVIFKIIDGKPLQHHTSAFMKIRECLARTTTANIRFVFKITRLSPYIEFVKDHLGQQLVLLCD